MKLIHCADLHIDSKLQTWLTEEKAKERKAEILANFPRLVEYARNNGVYGIMISGDLYDRNSASKHAENAVLNTIAANPEIMFFYVPGNHDDKCFLTRYNVLPNNLLVFDNRFSTFYLNSAHTISVSGIALTEENSRTFYDDVDLDKNCYNIFMLHGEDRAGGSARFEECIDFKLLRNRYIDYLALGHVHKPSLTELDNRCRMCYSGCLEGRGFDECGPRGFYLLDIDEYNRGVTYTFVPFAKRTMFSLFVQCDGCMTTEDIEQRIEDKLTEIEFSSTDFIRICLKGKVDALCEKDIPYLVKLFEKRAEVVRIEDLTELKVDYLSYADDKSLKGEFVRLVGQSNFSEEDKAEIIRMGISALMGEEIN
ncbi:MAG: DNA repair exonuclease [Lachnospiraceae bacterium]|nr:DNA repair exonuclease [Lachnospiraceae bacterium]